MNTDIELTQDYREYLLRVNETEQPYIEVELDPKIAKGVAYAMQQVAGVAKLYKRYGGPFKPLPANTKAYRPLAKSPLSERKPGARTIKRTLKFMR